MQCEWEAGGMRRNRYCLLLIVGKLITYNLNSPPSVLGKFSPGTPGPTHVSQLRDRMDQVCPRCDKNLSKFEHRMNTLSGATCS